MRHRNHWLAAAAATLLVGSGASWAQISVGLSIRIAPPALPVYVQPAMPQPGYLWAPGYWAWGDYGYYWVPGTWVQPPQPDLLWTPGYWGWGDGLYAWHEGYWGPRVGFYGGVNYGYGYGGVGYAGGYWAHGRLFYNSTVNRIPVGLHVTNVYHRAVNVTVVNHVSFNGGPGGLQARPSAAELAAAREPHVMPVAAQRQQLLAASREPALRASVNHGRPAIAASARPGQFPGRGGLHAHGAPARGQPARGPAAARATNAHGGPGERYIPERAGANRDAPGRPAAQHEAPPAHNQPPKRGHAAPPRREQHEPPH